MRRVLLTTLVILTTVTVMPAVGAAADGPAFDCRKAQGEAQALICKDPDLAALDRQLDEVYRAALSKAKKDKSALRADQDEWAKIRDACAKDPDAMPACLGRSYQARVGELQALYDLAPSKGPYTFDCANGAGSIVVKYFHTEPASARLQRGGETVVAWSEPGAKGSKFVGHDVTFLNKGMSAQVAWRNEKLNCEVRSPPAK